MPRVSKSHNFCRSSFISLISVDSIFRTCVELQFTVNVGHAAGPDSTQTDVVSRATVPVGTPLFIPPVKNDE